MATGCHVYILCLVVFVMIASFLTPFAVALLKGVFRQTADTLAMPVLFAKVDPLLMAILAWRTFKQFIYAGEGLIEQCFEKGY